MLQYFQVCVAGILSLGLLHWPRWSWKRTNCNRIINVAQFTSMSVGADGVRHTSQQCVHPQYGNLFTLIDPQLWEACWFHQQLWTSGRWLCHRHVHSGGRHWRLSHPTQTLLQLGGAPILGHRCSGDSQFQCPFEFLLWGLSIKAVGCRSEPASRPVK